MLTLNIERRETKLAGSSNSEALRKAGKLPAVFYGSKEKSTPIVVSMIDFVKVWKKAGESTVVVLKEKTGSKEYEALIHDIDVHPVTGTPRHADFYVIEKGQKVKVHIPIVFEGVSPAVKDMGGILVKVLHEVEVEASPKDLPHEIKIDISALKDLTSVITLGDVKLGSGATIVGHKEEILASIALAKEEVEEVKPVDMSAIEVEKKGKEAKEGEEGEVVGADAKETKEGSKKEDKKA